MTSATRHPAAPELPTIAEAGLPRFATGTWFGLLAPTGTPVASIDRLNAETRAALKTAETRGAVEALGFTAAEMSAAQFGQFIAGEVARWGTVVRTRGIKAD